MVTVCHWSCGNRHPCPRGAGGKWGSGGHWMGLGGEQKWGSAELEEVNGSGGAAVGSG